MGNTCYMNATVQAMRAIPELQVALSPTASTSRSTTSSGSLGPLSGSLRDLYSQMGRTTEGVMPIGFLNSLRAAVPQFGEVDRSRAAKGMMAGMGAMYAQQDAEECWTAITNALKDVPGLEGKESEGASNQVQAEGAGRKKFVEQFLMAEMRRE
jgi:ubiquitin carboxyl-terminal hydrolase 14